MKLDKQTQDTLNLILNSDNIPTNSFFRYWGNDVELLYETLWAKSNKEWDIGLDKLKQNENADISEHDANAQRYSKLMKILKNNYPHLQLWVDEMIGIGGLKVC